MTPPDIRIVTCSVSDALDWLNGVGPLNALPVADSSTCHWFTLNDSNAVQHNVVQKNDGPVVAILHQSGFSTPPEKVWPDLQRYAFQDTQAGEPLWLVLAGGLLPQRKADWQQNLSLATPGKPPLVQLVVFGLLLSLFRGVFVRVPKVLKRLAGRKG